MIRFSNKGNIDEEKGRGVWPGDIADPKKIEIDWSGDSIKVFSIEGIKPALLMEAPKRDIEISAMTVTTRYGTKGITDIELSQEDAGACRDLNGAATDNTAHGCDWYDGAHKRHCGLWDDEDFSAKTMCCGCQGI